MSARSAPLPLPLLLRLLCVDPLANGCFGFEAIKKVVVVVVYLLLLWLCPPSVFLPLFLFLSAKISKVAHENNNNKSCKQVSISCLHTFPLPVSLSLSLSLYTLFLITISRFTSVCTVSNLAKKQIERVYAA